MPMLGAALHGRGVGVGAARTGEDRHGAVGHLLFAFQQHLVAVLIDRPVQAAGEVVEDRVEGDLRAQALVQGAVAVYAAALGLAGGEGRVLGQVAGGLVARRPHDDVETALALDLHGRAHLVKDELGGRGAFQSPRVCQPRDHVEGRRDVGRSLDIAGAALLVAEVRGLRPVLFKAGFPVGAHEAHHATAQVDFVVVHLAAGGVERRELREGIDVHPQRLLEVELEVPVGGGGFKQFADFVFFHDD